MTTTSAGRRLVLASAVCFGTTGTAQALGVTGASPVSVGAGRILVGAAGLLLAAWWLARPTGLRLPLSRAALVGAAGVAGYQPAFFAAVDLTGVAVGTVVALGSAPVITGLLAWASGRGRPGPRWAVATAVSTAGLLVLGLAGGGSAVRPLGVLAALGAGACYAVYTLATERLLDGGTAAETAVATVFTGGALLLAPALLLVPVGWMVTPAGAGELLFLGLVPTALAYVLFARGLRVVGAAETATLTLAEPLTAAALGTVLLGERLPAAGTAGAALLVAGLAVLAAPSRRRRGTGPAPAAAPDPVAG